ncbi:hypothetical protein [Streptacidiphilus sp. EB103A]|uniref:hypothetical protein n=1 Tax=Streptacidiphilus sp. EB103A TaxID=3156275 RepID=UPI0035141745
MTNTAFELWCAVGAVTLVTAGTLGLHPDDYSRTLHFLDYVLAGWYFTGLISLGLGGVL